MKIQINLFTANHSETDDQIKHVNIIMKHYLQAFINYFQNDWIQWFSDAEFAVNNTNFFSILMLFFLANYDQHFYVEFESEKSLSQNFIVQNHVNLIAVNEFNFLIMKFNFSETMQIHFVFHVNLLQFAVDDSLLSQQAELQESVVVTDNQHTWYVNSILDFKYNHHCQFHFLKYLMNWESHWLTWELFDYLTENIQKILNEYHVTYSNWLKSYILSYVIFFCHCKNSSSYLWTCLILIFILVLLQVSETSVL